MKNKCSFVSSQQRPGQNVVHVGCGHILLVEDYENFKEWLTDYAKTVKRGRESKQLKTQLVQLIRAAFWPADTAKFAYLSDNRLQLFHTGRFYVVQSKKLCVI